MGNEDSSEIKGFEMNIQLIGKGLTKFKESLAKAESKLSIEKFWKFD